MLGGGAYCGPSWKLATASVIPGGGIWIRINPQDVYSSSLVEGQLKGSVRKVGKELPGRNEPYLCCRKPSFSNTGRKGEG